MNEPAKPASKVLRLLRIGWASLLGVALLFSILMAAWGDLREGLMLQLIDDRYVKSFTVQAPQGAKVWLGTEYLGESVPHPLADGESEDFELEVEGMSVLLPRVYFYEPQLAEQSVVYTPADSTQVLLKQLLPEAKLLWVESETMGETGFHGALLRHDDGRLDYVNLGRADWPTRDGTERRAFVLRVATGESHVFRLERLELWSDQLRQDEGGFWPRRDEFSGYPEPLAGQSKTVWRWYLATEPDDAVLRAHAPAETDVKWFKLPEK